MLANVSGQLKPIKLTLLDLPLIYAALRSSHDIDKVTDYVTANPLTKVIAPKLGYSDVSNRFMTLAPAIKPNLDSNTLTILALPNVAENATLPEENFYLSNNHSIELTNNGFVTWSAKHDSFFQISDIDVAILFSFQGGKTTQQAIDDIQINDMVDCKSSILKLIEAGLLVKKIVETQSLTSSDASKPFIVESEEGQKPEEIDWKNIKPDGRTPVYFVPHMENHLPLALGVLFNALASHENGNLLEHFLLVPLQYLGPGELLNGPYKKFGRGVWLFSNYMWSIELNLQISEAIFKHDPKNITIHGGPSTPDYERASEKFMNENQSVSISVHGEGEVTITEIFDVLSYSRNSSSGFDSFKMSQVQGITFRDALSNKIIRTESRVRMKYPDAIPSPYLSGTFNNYGGRVEAAIIESNRGCPYGCTFCDWGSATNQKIRKFDLSRVLDEITWIGNNKIKVIWIADANYGMYERDIEISEHIVATKRKYGYPKEVVVNYTKNSNKRLVDIIKIFNEGGIISQGIISIQTTDEKTLEVINRKNIKTERYDELSAIFAEQKLPLSTDLMIGLPGITVSAFEKDIQHYIDMDVTVKAYPTQLLPNSPMADPDYIEKYKIKVDQQNFVISSFSFSEDDLKYMKAFYQTYVMADGYGLLRYIIRFLQWEYGVQASTFLRRLLEKATENPGDFPLITWAVKYFNSDKCMPGGWNAFYFQVKSYLISEHGVKPGSDLDVVLAVNKASMPDDGLSYPLSISIEHDFTSYFVSGKTNFIPLKSYSEGVFEVKDPNNMTGMDLNSLQYDSHQYFWELNSSVARPKSVTKNDEAA
ncbi:B12-binding domain-containing radical SAM protein [Alteromonas ponticola]|uniref:Radical SAM protein n=1 Tax=Alteromonas ponticola TaxID=2720613 RepID=A0ABX1R8A1_9ALTE|nr:radical SAM protein [Alteromonas ponticola]NMH61480.1 radical SAM protein [Alteromonas ponticola]